MRKLSKVKKRKTLILFMISLLLNNITTHAFADTINKNSSYTQNASSKSNIELLTHSINKIEYTYIENGTNYKVIEEINSDFSYIESKVYKNINNKYEVKSIIKTYIDGNNFTVETSENNEISTKKFNLEALINTEDEYIDDMKTQNLQRGLGNWTYLKSKNSSSIIPLLTVAGVTSVLAGIASLHLPEAGKIAINALTNIALIIIGIGIPVVYYTTEYYYRYSVIDGTSVPLAERIISNIYSNSLRTDFIGRTLPEDFYMDDPDGWVISNGNWYYFNSNNVKLKGWQQISGKWYFFETSRGIMQSDWLKLNGKWYYLDPINGDMKTDWQSINGKWYFFYKSGSMATGWIQPDSYWYYLDPENGDMKTGWQSIGGKWYYFYSPSGRMATNTVIDGWKIDSNGVATPLRSGQDINESPTAPKVNEDVLSENLGNDQSIDTGIE